MGCSMFQNLLVLIMQNKWTLLIVIHNQRGGNLNTSVRGGLKWQAEPKMIGTNAQMACII